MAGSDDRLSQLKAFDDTKAGVKGLVDAGVAAVPPIFHHPPDPHAAGAGAAAVTIPVVDLAAAASDRAGLVAQVRAAAESIGFFQVVNHGVPGELLAETLASVCRFHEAPAEARRPYYNRGPARRVRYQSNFDLFSSPAANWRDTLFLELPAPEEEIPPACSAAVPEYARRVQELGRRLLGFLSEAMGLDAGYLEKDAGCLDGDRVVMTCHYYPPCPEPEKTLGTTRHSDPSFLTVLLQDGGVGGARRRELLGGRAAVARRARRQRRRPAPTRVQRQVQERGAPGGGHEPGRRSTGLGGLLLKADRRRGVHQEVRAHRRRHAAVQERDGGGVPRLLQGQGPRRPIGAGPLQPAALIL